MPLAGSVWMLNAPYSIRSALQRTDFWQTFRKWANEYETGLVYLMQLKNSYIEITFLHPWYVVKYLKPQAFDRNKYRHEWGMCKHGKVCFGNQKEGVVITTSQVSVRYIDGIFTNQTNYNNGPLEGKQADQLNRIRAHWALIS